MTHFLNEGQRFVSTNAKSEQEIRFAEFTHSNLVQKGNYLEKELLNLSNDAVLAGLETEAMHLERGLRRTRNAMQEITGKIGEIRISNQPANPQGGAANIVTQLKNLVDISPPKFSGDNDNCDFYSFKTSFDEYKSIKHLNDCDSLIVLKNKCLKGSALRACEFSASYEELWSDLKKLYGDPRKLVSVKISKISALGKCPLHVEKGKEWCINMKADLVNLKKVAMAHNIIDSVYYSPVVDTVQNFLPPQFYDKFQDKLLESFPDPSRRQIFEQMLSFLEYMILRYGAAMSKQNASNLIQQKKFEPPEQKTDQKPRYEQKSSQKFESKKRSTYFAAETETKDDNFENLIYRFVQNNGDDDSFSESDVESEITERERQIVAVNYVKPKSVPCTLCPKEHDFITYCPEFIQAGNNKKFTILAEAKVCFRCLRMDSALDRENRAEWFVSHSNNCSDEWVCDVEKCQKRSPLSQMHFLVCPRHKKQNADRLKKYLATLDQKKLPKDASLFFNATFVNLGSPKNETLPFPPSIQNCFEKGQEILPDVEGRSIFMLQNVETVNNENLLVFFDSGCSNSGLSDRAAKILPHQTVRPGPTRLDICAGEHVELETGDERFWLDLNDGSKATITGLQMPTITTPLPEWNLTEAWLEICEEFEKVHGKESPLPPVPKSLGGKEVDIIIGAKYFVYFPQQVFTLPSGLGIYQSPFKSEFSGVLGGPHHSWLQASQKSHHMGARAYFSSELRAYFLQDYVLTRSSSLLCTPNSEENLYIEQEWSNQEEPCENTHCDKHVDDSWVIPEQWNLYHTKYNVKHMERSTGELEDVGAEHLYRCIRCRNCQDCRNSDHMEKISLQEEREQKSIEDAVSYNPEKKRLVASLPFVKSPGEFLKPNKSVATKVFNSQMKMIHKNPHMKPEILKSFQKLASNGFVKRYEDLNVQEKARFGQSEGSKHFIPWRVVHKSDSISTPVRLVFDASARTPGGESLNALLPKGQNTLASLFYILLRFSFGEVGMCADVRMAYNQIFLHPEFYQYQMFLWKDNLDEKEALAEWIIVTLIYGVKPSGGMTIDAFRKLAAYARETHPELWEAAKKLADDTYLDDLVSTAKSVPQAEKLAEEIKVVLDMGSMSVKDFTFSGRAPSPEVSSDGQSVGVLGYLWFPLQDLLALNISPVFFGKVRRGVKPDKIEGDFTEAFKKHFTRRTILSKVAGVYDIRGLATPITAKLKLNFHELNSLKLGWDDLVPQEYFETWVQNLNTIQNLSEIRFKRSIIPPDAATDKVDLIISADASQKIAIATVHSRVQLKNGSYFVQLVCAKSKIVDHATIPRAELRAATMSSILGHSVKKNLGDKFGDCLYITDSTIALHWIHMDQRPLCTAVRNCVIEIRRFCNPQDWRHIESQLNIADLGTRPATIDQIGEGSEWQQGKHWMTLNVKEMPLKTMQEVAVTAEEKRAIAVETRPADVQGIHLSALVDKVSQRHSFSKYLLDPCQFSWDKSVRIMSYVYKFVSKVKSRVNLSKKPESLCIVKPPYFVELSENELEKGANYFFKKASKEVKQFCKKSEYQECSEEKDGILYFSGRVLEGQTVTDIENTFLDISPLSFKKPIVDRHSPVAYSVMSYVHQKLTNHKNVVTCVREAFNIAYIVKARSLADEIRKNCPKCKRFKAQRVEVEMAKIHDSRLTIAPPFYLCQVDLFGPLHATCEHNHRSKVKIWGLIFKDPASSAIAVHTMQNYTTDAFMQAYIRFAAIRGHPSFLFIDGGSQLVKACNTAEFSLLDVKSRLQKEFCVGIQHEICPRGGHNFHGNVERSVQEVKKLFTLVFQGLKLDILAFETSFAWIANELNNLPICYNNRYKDLEKLQIISPNRLLLGRNNRRSMTGQVTAASPTRLLKQMQEVYKSWWTIWQEEKILEYVPQPPKWSRNSQEVKLADIVIFPREDENSFDVSWRLGRVKQVFRSKDGKVRKIQIEYKNENEKTFRTTERTARQVAVLHSENEVCMVDELNTASKCANILFCMKSSLINACPECETSISDQLSFLEPAVESDREAVHLAQDVRDPVQGQHQTD